MGELRIDAVTPPPPANSFLGGAATAAGVLFTVPAGRVWRGRISAAASTPSTGTITVQTGGTGVTPPSTQPLFPIVTLSTTNQSVSADSGSAGFFIYAGSTDAPISVVTTGTVTCSVVAYGWLVS